MTSICQISCPIIINAAALADNFPPLAFPIKHKSSCVKLCNKTIELFNYGNHSRDFTFVEDVAECLFKLLVTKKSNNKFNVYNISNSKPVSIKKIINLLKGYTKLNPKISYLKMQLGDVKKTHGSNIKLIRAIGKIRFTPIEIGIKKFVDWYNDYHK